MAVWSMRSRNHSVSKLGGPRLSVLVWSDPCLSQMENVRLRPKRHRLPQPALGPLPPAHPRTHGLQTALALMLEEQLRIWEADSPLPSGTLEPSS